MPLNTWLYVVGVYDGTDNAYIYVNGALRDSVSGAGAPITSSASSAEIGRDLGTGIRRFRKGLREEDDEDDKSIEERDHEKS